MKAKAIKKLLKGFIDNLCKTISNEKIVEIIKDRTYITGGCIPSMLLDEFVNDFDIYFISKEDAIKVKEYYKTRKKADSEKFHVKLITENSINLSDKAQFIIKFTGEPKEVIDNFDWQHIKSHYQYPDKLYLTDDVYKLIVEKDLVYTGSKYPLSSMLRTRKFIKKGWNVSTKTILNITLDIVEAFYNPTKNYTSQNVINNIHNEIGSMISNEKEYTHKFSVEEILYHLNGVDPLTIQAELEKQTGKHLTILEIINLIQEG
jgi:hypothetical protein